MEEKGRVIFNVEEQQLLNDLATQGRCRGCQAVSITQCLCLSDRRWTLLAKVRRKNENKE